MSNEKHNEDPEVKLEQQVDPHVSRDLSFASHLWIKQHSHQTMIFKW